VWRAFQCPDQNAKKRLEALLTALTSKMVSRGSPFDGTRSWLENAEEEHRHAGFRLILARDNPRRHSEVVLGTTIEEATEPRWAIRQSVAVVRDPEQLAAAVAPMLRCCSEVVFVDPHFRPDEIRYRRTLGAFLNTLLRNRRGPLPPRVELQVNQDLLGRAHFEQQCKARLPAVIPRGLTLRVVRWKQQPGGQELHNRYILTDIGGVSFGHGLDESADSAAGGTTDDVKRFDEDGYLQRWKDYASATPAFKQEEAVLLIEGNAPLAAGA
jgi:hypothetical protein